MVYSRGWCIKAFFEIRPSPQNGANGVLKWGQMGLYIVFSVPPHWVLYFLRQGFSLNLKLTTWARLTSQWLLESCSASQCWHYKYEREHLTFYMGPNSDLMLLVWWALYWLSQLLGLYTFYFSFFFKIVCICICVGYIYMNVGAYKDLRYWIPWSHSYR